MYFRVQSSSTILISMCEIFLRWNVFVRLYAFKLKDHISIGNCRCKCGSCQSLNRVVELEGVCLPKFSVPWPKTTKLLRPQKDWPNLHFA